MNGNASEIEVYRTHAKEYATRRTELEIEHTSLDCEISYEEKLEQELTQQIAGLQERLGRSQELIAFKKMKKLDVLRMLDEANTPTFVTLPLFAFSR